MRESSVFQHVIEPRARERYHRGREQGAREAAIRNLLTALEFRFDGVAVQALGPAVESIQEPLRLEDLHREALHAETFEDFTRALGATLDPLS